MRTLDPSLQQWYNAESIGLDAPQGIDDSQEPDRKLTNMDIGRLMLADLAATIERLRPKGARHTDKVVEAVEDLIQVARQRARKEGKPTWQVLREHRNVIDGYGERGSKFLRSAKEENKTEEDDRHDLRRLRKMKEQDRRRDLHAPGTAAMSGARTVEYLETQANGLAPSGVRPELQPPSNVSTNTRVDKKPAPMIPVDKDRLRRLRARLTGE